MGLSEKIRSLVLSAGIAMGAEGCKPVDKSKATFTVQELIEKIDKTPRAERSEGVTEICRDDNYVYYYLNFGDSTSIVKVNSTGKRWIDDLYRNHEHRLKEAKDEEGKKREDEWFREFIKVKIKSASTMIDE